MAKVLVAGQKVSSSPPPGQKITDYKSLMMLSQEEGQNSSGDTGRDPSCKGQVRDKQPRCGKERYRQLVAGAGRQPEFKSL